jgi:uncharacterized protein (TIGR02118 family)
MLEQRDFFPVAEGLIAGTASEPQLLGSQCERCGTVTLPLGAAFAADPPATLETTMHRVLFAMYRKEGTSSEEFLAHYRDVHIPITRRFAGLRHYEVLPVSSADADDAPDAFAVMAFDSEEDFQAVLGTPEFQEAMEDSATFVARASSYLVDQIPVVTSEDAIR